MTHASTPRAPDEALTPIGCRKAGVKPQSTGYDPGLVGRGVRDAAGLLSATASAVGRSVSGTCQRHPGRVCARRSERGGVPVRDSFMAADIPLVAAGSEEDAE